jgi:hypothetical protein
VARDGEFSSEWASVMETILREGPLSRRILNALAGDRPRVSGKFALARARLHDVYAELCDSLKENRTFHAQA